MKNFILGSIKYLALGFILAIAVNVPVKAAAPDTPTKNVTLFENTDITVSSDLSKKLAGETISSATWYVRWKNNGTYTEWNELDNSNTPCEIVSHTQSGGIVSISFVTVPLWAGQGRVNSSGNGSYELACKIISSFGNEIWTEGIAFYTLESSYSVDTAKIMDITTASLGDVIGSGELHIIFNRGTASEYSLVGYNEVYFYDGTDVTTTTATHTVSNTEETVPVVIKKQGEVVIKTFVKITNAADTTPPDIDDVDFHWADGDGEITTPTWDPTKIARIRIAATDNVTEKDKLLYRISYKGEDDSSYTYLTNGFTALTQDEETAYYDLDLDEAGNGSYIVEVRDEALNISSSEDLYVLKKYLTDVEFYSDTTPYIISLTVANASTYQTKKNITVKAADESGSGMEFLWVSDSSTAAKYEGYIDNRIKNTEGYKSILANSGWGTTSTITATEEGTYTVFVKNDIGNMDYDSVEVTKLSSEAPTITNIQASCINTIPQLTVTAVCGTQSLQYKLNDGAYQASNILTGLNDGYNIVYVKNEAGIVANASKYIYLDALKNNISGFSSTKLYTYISHSPTTWTNGTVKVRLNLPTSLTDLLAEQGYSTDGGTNWRSDSALTLEANKDVTYTVKDIYGYTHSSEAYTVGNIDTKKPTISTSFNANTLTITATDDLSGIKKVTILGGSEYTSETNVITEDTEKIVSRTGTATITKNGTYVIRAYDHTGNIGTSTLAISSFKDAASTTTGKNSTASKTANITPIPSYDSKTMEDELSDEIETIDILPGNTEPAEDYGSNNYVSDAGHKPGRILEEVHPLEYFNNENEESTLAQILPVQIFSDEYQNKLSRLFIVVPLVGILAALTVFLLNSKYSPLYKKVSKKRKVSDKEKKSLKDLFAFLKH